MEQLSTEFKHRVIEKFQLEIEERGQADTAFLKKYDLGVQTGIKLCSGKTDKVMTDSEWFRLGRKLHLLEVERKWNAARTDVFNIIEEDIMFCKQHAKAKICVDDCGIGKTFTAKYLSKSLDNCFYVDASQGKSTHLFTRLLAKAVGLECVGAHHEIKEDIKCYLRMINNPIVIIDEAGDLGQNTLQDIKEFWNATEGCCGWYMMGADGLKRIMQKGMKKRKPGFKEVFSRFSERYTTTVPVGKQDRLSFYKKLITDVLEANMTDKSKLDEIVKKCLVMDDEGYISGLRRAESLLLLYA